MSDLSPREDQVLRTIARTGSADMAARELNIARNTVRVHRASAYRKLGVHSDREAWLAKGWLRLPDER